MDEASLLRKMQEMNKQNEHVLRKHASSSSQAHDSDRKKRVDVVSRFGGQAVMTIAAMPDQSSNKQVGILNFKCCCWERHMFKQSDQIRGFK